MAWIVMDSFNDLRFLFLPTALVPCHCLPGPGTMTGAGGTKTPKPDRPRGGTGENLVDNETVGRCSGQEIHCKQSLRARAEGRILPQSRAPALVPLRLVARILLLDVGDGQELGDDDQATSQPVVSTK